MVNINVKTFSKIFIGKSNSNEKEYTLITKLDLPDFVITYPFGSNRTRYQFPEMFKYNLNKINETNESKNYKLIIKRNDKINCPKTGKFFWSNGWNFDLYISFIPDLSFDYYLDQNNILNLLPYDYANIDLTIPNNYANPEIGIVIPIFNRFNYLEKCFNSLKKTNLKNCILILMDESMTKEVNDDKKKVNKLVNDFQMDNTIICKIYKTNHGNMFDSILHGFDLLVPFCKYFITLDSDTIHKIDWVEKLFETYKLLKQDNKNILISGFNTVNTNFHKILKKYDNYMEKNSVGGCNMFFDKDNYLNLIRYGLISYKWDTNLIKNLKDNGGKVYVTKPSVIDHIGINSSGHRNDKNLTYDIAIDF